MATLKYSYARSRSEAIPAAVAETSSALLKQQLNIEQQVAIKREELETFRANNNILSLGRDENEVYAKLKGLTEALNTALEKRITSIAPSDERAFSDLQRRQRKLRDKLTELDNKYTRDYMALHPEMKVIPEQLAAVEKQIAQKESAGKSLVLTNASRNYLQANGAGVQQQLFST